MLYTAKEIRKKCERDITALQQVCTHPITHWAEECWAPGHFSGKSVRVCETCEKILETK